MVYELIVTVGLNTGNPGTRPSMRRHIFQTEQECQAAANDFKQRLPHAQVICQKREIETRSQPRRK